MAGLLVVMMIAATVIEKTEGAATAFSSIYGSPFFTTGWIITAICSAVYIVCRKLQRNIFTFLLHAAFLIILAGAFTTRLTGKQGNIHLRTGEQPKCTYVTAEGQTEEFPFRIQLTAFNIDYYKGSFAPMDFVSHIRIDDKEETVDSEISMNKIFVYRHYRFYQSSYDKDMNGTILAVAYDPWGIGITYAGYSLLLLSFLGFFFQKSSQFRQLLHHPALRKSIPMLLFVLSPSFLWAASDKPKHISQETASRMGNLYLYYHDRICPLQTLAKEFTQKIYGATSYKGLSGEQVLTGWFFFYDRWKEEPFIHIKSKAVQGLLGIEGEYASLNDFFGSEGYKLKNAGNENAKLNREINEANEKFNLISMVATGSILKIFPCRTDGNVSWFAPVDDLPKDLPGQQRIFVRKSLGLVTEQIVKGNDSSTQELLGKIRQYQQKTAGEVLPSDNRFMAERVYNRLHHTKVLAMFCLSVGICAFIYYCRLLVNPSAPCRRHLKVANALLSGLLGVVFLYLLTVISLRGYVSGHLPISNGYEIMQAMAACTALPAFLFFRKFEFVLASGYLVCGFALLVSMLGESNPPITPLMPVLSSPLLSLHVMTIMFAYSLLAFVMLDGIAALIVRYAYQKRHPGIERLYVVSRILLYPAVFLLATGIFIGAVWANVSWGRYWGWDPKETWALITLMVYAASFHTSSLPKFRDPVFFHWFSVISFLSVLITYFGVNFFMGGMHSYA